MTFFFANYAIVVCFTPNTGCKRAKGERMQVFSPRLDVLPEAQRRLWAELTAVPGEFTLYGGTALALHLGHRKSADFDFFGKRAIDVAALEGGISFLEGAAVIQRDKNTLSAIVERAGPVKVSFSRGHIGTSEWADSRHHRSAREHSTAAILPREPHAASAARIGRP
jgi:hypothetical protein